VLIEGPKKSDSQQTLLSFWLEAPVSVVNFFKFGFRAIYLNVVYVLAAIWWRPTNGG
jgi:hypothetical protein